MKDGPGVRGSRWRVEQEKGKDSHGDWMKEDSDAESEDEGGKGRFNESRENGGRRMVQSGSSASEAMRDAGCKFVDICRQQLELGLMTGLLRRPILQTHTRRSECPSWHSWQALEAGWARSAMDLPFAMA